MYLRLVSVTVKKTQRFQLVDVGIEMLVKAETFIKFILSISFSCLVWSKDKFLASSPMLWHHVTTIRCWYYKTSICYLYINCICFYKTFILTCFPSILNCVSTWCTLNWFHSHHPSAFECYCLLISQSHIHFDWTLYVRWCVVAWTAFSDCLWHYIYSDFLKVLFKILKLITKKTAVQKLVTQITKWYSGVSLQ